TRAREQRLAGLDLFLECQLAALGGLGRLGNGREVRRRPIAQIYRVDLLAGIDEFVFRTVDLEGRQRALVEGAKDRVSDEDVAAGYVGVELDHDRAACRNQRRLYVLLFMRAAFVTNLVEYFADNVQAPPRDR